MNLAMPKLNKAIPYLTYAILWLVMSLFASELLPREYIGFAAQDPESGLALMKAHLWKDEILRTGLQLLVIPCAVFGALKTGHLSVRGLLITAIVLYLSLDIWVAWVLDGFKSPEQVTFFSIQGLRDYPYWEFVIWHTALNAIVPILALIAIRHLKGRSSGTLAAPLD